MNCEEFLMGYRRALGRIVELDGDIEEERERRERKTAKYGGVLVKSSGEPNAKLDTLGELLLKRERLEAEAVEKQKEINSFISSVGIDTEEGRRYRKLLRLYYVDALDWEEVCLRIKPIQVRSDGRLSQGRKNRHISIARVFSLRREALTCAEMAYRKMNKFSR